MVCLECECCEDGSVDGNCDADGKCTCKEHIAGDKCDEAAPGYYEFPDPKRKILFILLFYRNFSFLWILSKVFKPAFFIACECNMDGSEDNTCNDEGQCNCKCNIKVLKYYAAYDDDYILINEFISLIFIGRQM